MFRALAPMNFNTKRLTEVLTTCAQSLYTLNSKYIICHGKDRLTLAIRIGIPFPWPSRDTVHTVTKVKVNDRKVKVTVMVNDHPDPDQLFSGTRSITFQVRVNDLL